MLEAPAEALGQELDHVVEAVRDPVERQDRLGAFADALAHTAEWVQGDVREGGATVKEPRAPTPTTSEDDGSSYNIKDYEATAEAYLRGIERRVEAGLEPNIASVASLFISRWDAHTASDLPPELTNVLGIAVAQRAYRAYRKLLASDRWRDLASAGAKPQRLLWASTGTKDPAIPDTYYVTALAGEGTVDTMPEKVLLAFADHGEFEGLLGEDASEADRVISEIEKAGVDVDALASTLQTEGRDLFVESWNDLLACIESKRDAMRGP